MKYYLYLKTNKLYLLEIYISFFEKLSKNFNFKLKKKILPANISRFSVYKSPHVNKKAKDHYQTKWYKYVLILENLNNLYILKQELKNNHIKLNYKLKCKM